MKKDDYLLVDVINLEAIMSTVESDKVCRECSLIVNDDFYTVCKGDCAGFFHGNCVGLRDIHVNILFRSQNIIWLCDTCMNDFNRKKNSCLSDNADAKSQSSIENDVKELKNNVTVIMDIISKLEPKSSEINLPLLHSTPISSFTLLHGSNECNQGDLLEQRTKEDDCFSLLLTNIDSSATEYDVKQLVSRAIVSLDSEQIDVTKLVSYWKRKPKLDYISFKIIIPRQYKSYAMDPVTWPKNVKFREFFNKNDAWKP